MRLLLALLTTMTTASFAAEYAPDPAAGPMFGLSEVRPLPPVDAEATVDVAMPQSDSTAMEEVIIEEELPKPVKLWEASFELGLDGATGNTDTFNFRFGLDAKRKTDHNVLTLDLDYRKSTNQQLETANRAFLDWRNEWLFGKSPWTYFVHGTVDYDEFKAFDVRVTMDTGLGYKLISTDKTTFTGRVGGGFSREVGGPDDTYVPEAVFGLDFEHRINKRQKLTASSEYTPDMTAMNDFRLKTRAGWEALIDEAMNLSLKLSVMNSYDSTPNGAEPNDLDYSAVLLWKF